MKIFLRKTSLVDYPGHVSSVIFFSGCNLRCPWCQNGDLVLGKETGDLIGVDESLAHIRKRQQVLGGVVLSGGEPCLWEGLPDLVAEIKKLQLLVKLDTNGLFPAMLEKLFDREETRPDYIALDLKIAPSRYGELKEPTGKTPSEAPGIEAQNPNENSRASGALIQSAALIRESGIMHEYRTLALPDGFITEKDIEALAPLTDGAPWYFRLFRSGDCLDPAWNRQEEQEAELDRSLKILAQTLAEKAKKLGKNGIIP
ncbi:MAG: anaerobic ribonucleoside-triphosphate reductase activating protein [Treponema sp.]|nr:anaerobic ribonucleoside-triphosphate reductase activating protein [Treponema sp.]